MSGKTFISQLNWRYACKGFVAGKSIGADKIAKIIDSVVAAPTSFGLQPFYVVAVRDQDTKEKFKQAGWNQIQFSTAEVVLVFVARMDVKKRISEFVDLIKTTEPARAQTIKEYEAMMRGSLEGRSFEQLKEWASRQTYIALGFALAACAELEVHSCPMEGFDPVQFNKILDLPPEHTAVVSLAIGVGDPGITHLPKLRFPATDVVR